MKRPQSTDPCAKLGPTKSGPVSCFSRVISLKANDAEGQEQGLQGRTCSPHGSTRGAVGPPIFQGKKAETTQAHVVGDLHAGVVLSMITVLLQLNMHSFADKKLFKHFCLISHIQILS